MYVANIAHCFNPNQVAGQLAADLELTPSPLDAAADTEPPPQPESADVEGPAADNNAGAAPTLAAEPSEAGSSVASAAHDTSVLHCTVRFYNFEEQHFPIYFER